MDRRLDEPGKNGIEELEEDFDPLEKWLLKELKKEEEKRAGFRHARHGEPEP